jgi:hypothetical protein
VNATSLQSVTLHCKNVLGSSESMVHNSLQRCSDMVDQRGFVYSEFSFSSPEPVVRAQNSASYAVQDAIGLASSFVQITEGVLLISTGVGIGLGTYLVMSGSFGLVQSMTNIAGDILLDTNGNASLHQATGVISYGGLVGLVYGGLMSGDSKFTMATGQLGGIVEKVYNLGLTPKNPTAWDGAVFSNDLLSIFESTTSLWDDVTELPSFQEFLNGPSLVDEFFPGPSGQNAVTKNRIQADLEEVKVAVVMITMQVGVGSKVQMAPASRGLM